MDLRISRFLPVTKVEGPGIRSCIWVQGCPIRCPDCANKSMWPFEGGTSVSVAEIFDRILRQKAIEGITLLGGEPFYQAGALAELAYLVKDAGLSVITFTGYEYEYLLEQDREDWNRLLEMSDILIDGPYIGALADLSRPWVGSSNQRYHFLTDRYVDVAEQIFSTSNKIELHVYEDGSVRANGMCCVEKLKEISMIF